MPVGRVEGGVGEPAAGPDAVGDFAVGVGVARVGHRLLAEERFRGGVGVLVVDRKERDLLAVLGAHLLEGRELEPAGPAPRCPDVDDGGESPQGLDPGFVGVEAAPEQFVGLTVERRERRRGAGQRLRVVGVAATGISFLGSAPGDADNEGDECHRGDQEPVMQCRQFLDYNTFRSVRRYASR